jgi:hypothetical protein
LFIYGDSRAKNLLFHDGLTLSCARRFVVTSLQCRKVSMHHFTLQHTSRETTLQTLYDQQWLNGGINKGITINLKFSASCLLFLFNYRMFTCFELYSLVFIFWFVSPFYDSHYLKLFFFVFIYHFDCIIFCLFTYIDRAVLYKIKMYFFPFKIETLIAAWLL